MNFLFWEYILNISDYVSANIQASCIKDKRTVKAIIKFSIIKLIILLFFINENNKVKPIK